MRQEPNASWRLTLCRRRKTVSTHPHNMTGHRDGGPFVMLQRTSSARFTLEPATCISSTRGVAPAGAGEATEGAVEGVIASVTATDGLTSDRPRSLTLEERRREGAPRGYAPGSTPEPQRPQEALGPNEPSARRRNKRYDAGQGCGPVC